MIDIVGRCDLAGEACGDRWASGNPREEEKLYSSGKQVWVNGLSLLVPAMWTASSKIVPCFPHAVGYESDIV